MNALPTSLNWYDYVVALAVLSGFYTGLRAGLFRSFLRTLMWALMTLVGLLLYQTVGIGLHDFFGLETDSANVQAFLLLGLVVFILSRAAIREIMYRVSQHSLSPAVDNVGGAFLGVPLMLAFLVWLTITLALLRSPTWDDVVVRHSCFGARCVWPFAAIAAPLDEKKTQRSWLTEPLQRREEPTADGYKKQR
jgi:uncharacterized membrane protein required for colicin V production